MIFDDFKSKFVIDIKNSGFSPYISCVLFFGSQKKPEDIYFDSDIDIHFLLKPSAREKIDELKKILEKYDKLDISILFEDEMLLLFKKYGFQNGNQGNHFIYIFACSDCVFGKNIYIKMSKLLSKEKICGSLIFKINEYLWRLRKMYVESTLTVDMFKKYSARILLDILVLENKINIANIASYNQRQVVNLYLDIYSNEMSVSEIKLLSQIINLPDIYQPNYNGILKILSSNISKILNNK